MYNKNMTRDFKDFSNDGLRTTYQHFLGLQLIARRAKDNGVHEEVQGHMDAILKEASSRKVIL